MINNYKDIHRDFTEQLIAEWQEKGFTFNQTADWISIYSPQHQTWAINNPYYHAWLRDIKKKDSLWVLNYGDWESLQNQYNSYLFNRLQNLNTPDNQPSFSTTTHLLTIIGLSLLTIYLLTKTYD